MSDFNVGDIVYWNCFGVVKQGVIRHFFSDSNKYAVNSVLLYRNQIYKDKDDANLKKESNWLRKEIAKVGKR